MTHKQKTIKNTFTINGKGLHTGLDVKMQFEPAPANHGIKFQRTDLEGKPIVDAVIDHVVDTSRGTSLQIDGARIGTIEHVLSALTGMEVDNVLVKLNAPETPILDGSAKQYVDAIEKAGIEPLEEEKKYYYIKEKITYADPEKGIEISIFPDDHLSINALVDYKSKFLENQYAELDNLEQFKEEIACCRTFVFFNELEVLLNNDLIKGGDIENAIVIVDHEVSQKDIDRMAELFNKPKLQVQPGSILSNPELTFTNEPARHKLLDILGDITLVGQPIVGKIVAKRPGHKANTEFSRLIRKAIKKDQSRNIAPKFDQAQPPLYDVNQIMTMLPHRPPFLLVDKIMYMDENMIMGIKNVTMNESFFVGHFPGEPIMPGVLQIESMAQVGAILLLNSVPDPENHLTLFLKVDKVKFKRKVVPGDTLSFRLKLLAPIRRGTAHTFGQAFVGDNVVLEGEFLAQLKRKSES